MGENTSNLPLRPKANSHDQFLALGGELKSHFLSEPGYRNLNHGMSSSTQCQYLAVDPSITPSPGSFGTIPRVIQAKMREYQDQAEARPDHFIRYDSGRLLDESRAAVAELLHAPTDTVVLVSNATVGVNTVLRNLVWAADGRDEILHFDTIYGGCANTVTHIVESQPDGRLAARPIRTRYPCSTADVLASLAAAIQASKDAGKRPALCLFDVVTSIPGVRFPFEAVTAACRDAGMLSLIDGAQGVGMVPLDLAALDPDFFVTNCHKWLHVPRGCAALYVPRRNQPLIRSTMPTSHGLVPLGDAATPHLSGLAPTGKPPFVNNFEFVGTVDNAPYYCVRDAIAWRRDVLGGEERIVEYQRELARTGGRRVAEILGTEVMENEQGTLIDHAMVNVSLPLVIVAGEDSEGAGGERTDLSVPADEAAAAALWMEKVSGEYKTWLRVYLYQGRLWTRLSAQVYLDEEDFVFAGETLKDLCERVGRGEYK